MNELNEQTSKLFISKGTPEPKEAKFPVKTKQIACIIDGVHTEIILQVFADRVFIAITQTNKLGTMIDARKDGIVEIEETEPSYSVTVLIGKRDDPICTIYARQLIEFICNSSAVQRPLLLAIALKDNPATEKSTFKQIMTVIANNKIW